MPSRSVALSPIFALLIVACSPGADDPGSLSGASSSSGGAPGAVPSETAGGDGGAGRDGSVADEGGGGPGDARSDAPLVEPTGYFVAAGYGGRRVRSLDNGGTWQNDQSDVANGGDDQYLIRDVGWGGGQWLTAGGFNGNIKTSPNGASWTTQANSVGQWFGGVAYGNGMWVAVGGAGRRARSINGGVTWVDSYDNGASNGYRGLAYGPYMGHRWVGVGDGGRTTHTSDGVAWSIGTGVPGNYDLHSVAYGNGVFVAIVGNGSSNYARSRDGGATWTVAQLPAGARDITFGKGKFVVIGNDHSIDSADGTTWAQHAAAGMDGCVAYGNSTFVAVAGARTLTSSDGIAWSAKTNLTMGNYLERVRFGGTP
ncbi:MAG: hypothetical protein HOO96_28005 [Polyangiaceae bacterium]|nr:hypothetical protein [Polyangiaceae bacterium]